MTNYLIVPGYGNSGPEHWQTHFENTLPNCTRINQKSWDKPVMNDWVKNIDDAVRQFDPETVVLISHSMGGIAIAHWAEKYQLKIKGAMIVAPPDLENPYLDLEIKNFTPIPTSKLPFPAIIVASTNDHWASTERTIEFAENWGCKLYLIGDAGHINSDSGHSTWTEGLELLSSIC